MVERRSDVAQNIGPVLHEALIGDFPRSPISTRIRRRDWTLSIWNRVRRIGNEFAITGAITGRRRCERESSVAPQIKIRCLRIAWRPFVVSTPAIAAQLIRRHPPRRLRTSPVQVVTKEWRLDLLPKLARCLRAECDHPDAIAFGCLPFTVIPGTRNHIVGVIRIVLGGVMEYLPRAPRIFLIVKACDVEVGNRGCMKPIRPRTSLPE